MCNPRLEMTDKDEELSDDLDVDPHHGNKPADKPVGEEEEASEEAASEES